jgi:hypothetical protein
MPIPQHVADTIVDPKAYADGRIYESYAWLRANAPLAVAHPAGFDPFWVVTRHADILEISRQNDLFHSGDRATTITSRAADDHVRKMTTERTPLPIHCRPSSHQGSKELSRAFTDPGAIE